MLQLPEADVVLLHSLIDDEKFLPVLLRWIDPQSHGRAELLPDPTSLETEVLFYSPVRATSLDTTGGWKDKLNDTSPQSFALSFLHYMRAQLQPYFSGADQASGDAFRGSGNRLSAMPKSPGMPTEFCQASSSPRTNFGQVEPQLEKAATLDALFEPREERRKAMPTVKSMYEDEFPVLGAPCSTTLQPSVPQESKQKRRVTPTQTADLAVSSTFVLAKVESAAVNHGHVKAKRLGPRNLEVDMGVLMERCDKNRKPRPREKVRRGKKKNQVSSDDVIPSEILGPSNDGSSDRQHDSDKVPPSADEGSCAARDAGLEKAVTRHEESGTNLLSSMQLSGGDFQHDASNGPCRSLPGRLLKLSTVHATLMVSRMVPSLLAELQFLLQLLYIVGTPASSHTEQSAYGNRVFHDCGDCPLYACAVLEQAGPIVECVGEALLAALVDEPAISKYTPELLARLKAALIGQQAASLRSDKAYEHVVATDAVRTSPRIHLRLTAIPGLPVSLPFQSARDSRHNFKTPKEIKLYNNREQCRDLFYSVIREGAAAYSAFGCGAHESEEQGYTKIEECSKQFLKALLLDNYSWFAELFLEQVLQVYLCGDADPVVVGLAHQDQAKLQKLHDRLTGTSGCTGSARIQKQPFSGNGNGDVRLELSPSSPWSQVKNIHSTNFKKKGNNLASLQVMHEERAALSKEHSDFQENLKSRLSRFFPQFLRVYIWFLEVNDSHRLNAHLIWSITHKISNLTELSPDTGSATGFTQRVLALKALAGLLGFFIFSPGAGTLPPVLGVSSTTWTVSRNAIPIDVEGTLSAAKDKGIMLLVLPWVLEFLRLTKADEQVHYQPYFHNAVSALRDVYRLPMLDPLHPDFGVGSVCILAALDSFFEYMDLHSCIDNRMSSKDQVAEGIARKVVPGDDKIVAGQQFIGLDKVPGIVDNTYIRHCCPILVGMRMEVLEGKKRRQKVPSYLQSPGSGRQMRKITPVPSHSEWQRERASPRISGKNLTTCHVVAEPETLKINLQRSFLEQRPQLRRLVDFIVDIVAVNAASAAVSQFVPQVLKGALKKLDSTLCTESRMSGEDSLNTISSPEVAAEQIIASAICEALHPASDFLHNYAAKRTSEALSVLVYPHEASYAVGVAAGIAAETASLSAYQKALARMSTEIRRQITEEVQRWRTQTQRSFLDVRSKLALPFREATNHMAGPEAPAGGTFRDPLNSSQVEIRSGEDSQHGLQRDQAVQLKGELSIDQSLEQLTIEVRKRNRNVGRSTKLAAPVKRQLAFAGSSSDLSYQANGSPYVPPGKERELGLVDNIVQACSIARSCITSGSCADDKRNLLRQRLSVVCMSIEALLAHMGGIPAGGADRLVIERSGVVLLERLSLIRSADGPHQATPGKVKLGGSFTAPFRVELGLIRRSLALALRLAFTSPQLAFGLTSRTPILQCSCNSKMQGNAVWKMVVEFSLNAKPYADADHKPESSPCKQNHNPIALRQGVETSDRESAGCEEALWFSSQLAGPMLELVEMWKALVQQKMCCVKFVMGELLAPWRWALAFHMGSWQPDHSWLDIPKHGLIGVMLNIMGESLGVEEVQDVPCHFLRTLCLEVESETAEEQVRRSEVKDVAAAVGMHILMWCTHLGRT